MNFNTKLHQLWHAILPQHDRCTYSFLVRKYELSVRALTASTFCCLLFSFPFFAFQFTFFLKGCVWSVQSKTHMWERLTTYLLLSLSQIDNDVEMKPWTNIELNPTKPKINPKKPDQIRWWLVSKLNQDESQETLWVSHDTPPFWKLRRLGGSLRTYTTQYHIAPPAIL